MQTGRLESINVSDGGVPKRAVPEASVSGSGLSGDRQRDLRYHGGPDRAVSLYSAEVIAALAAEGHPIAAGTTGENLTLGGVAWREVRPGVEVCVGPVRLVVTSYASPCRNIAGSFAGDAFGRISQKTHAGWSRVYARVLESGVVRVGDAVRLEPERPLAGDARAGGCAPAARPR
jgi:MOSC domain-containing protein YiiM